LGIGDWGLGPIPNPQSPIPNPHPQSPEKHLVLVKCINNKFKIYYSLVCKYLKKIEKIKYIKCHLKYGISTRGLKKLNPIIQK